MDINIARVKKAVRYEQVYEVSDGDRKSGKIYSFTF